MDTPDLVVVFMTTLTETDSPHRRSEVESLTIKHV